ncbi:hypothetical protein B0H21DRAFT_81348 [Amylocystis lapponica]|nr:hypothetical protein B0H21DRAFT_81348 [Amylocystis lapponica]
MERSAVGQAPHRILTAMPTRPREKVALTRLPEDTSECCCAPVAISGLLLVLIVRLCVCLRRIHVRVPQHVFPCMARRHLPSESTNNHTSRAAAGSLLLVVLLVPVVLSALDSWVPRRCGGPSGRNPVVIDIRGRGLGAILYYTKDHGRHYCQDAELLASDNHLYDNSGQLYYIDANCI